MVTLDGVTDDPSEMCLLRDQGAEGYDDAKAKDNDLANQALTSAVYAFSIRWLTIHKNAQDEHSNSAKNTSREVRENLSDRIWQQAHQKMYPVMSRPSYRAILALHLFGITPVPTQNQDRRATDLCIEIALSHHKRMRSEEHIIQSSTQARPSSLYLPSFSPGQQDSPEELERSCMQDMAYWFSVTCDTSRSLTLCRSSILLPGHSGDMKVWSHVRGNMQDFHTSYQHLRHARIPMTDDAAIIILQHASACQKMFSSAIVRVQDALYHHEIDIPLETTIANAFRQFEQFEEVFGSHLDRCSRDFMLLNEQNQIGYGESVSLPSS